MIEIAILSAGTLLILALAFTGVVVVAYLTYSCPGRLFQGGVLAIATVSVLSTLLSGRVLRLGDAGLETLMDGDTGSTLIGKALLLVLAGSAFSICIAWGLWRFGRTRPPARYDCTGIAELNRLTWAFLYYYVTFSLLPLFFAPQFSFHVSLVYPMFIWFALLLSLRTSSFDPVAAVRQACGLIVIASLAAAVLLPTLSLQPGYKSLLPGFTMRLWGVTASANTLGSVAGTLLVLQFVFQTKRNFAHHLMTICALTALVLTQSKSAMAAASFGLAILFSWNIYYGSKATPRSFTRFIAGTGLMFLLSAALLAALWIALSEPAIWNALERKLDRGAVGNLSTLTGRTDIWSYAVERGMASPIFGQGLAMWDIHARLTTGLIEAVHAHNLYLQAFSRAGFVGLAALLLLVTYIVRYAFMAAKATGGGSMALLAMFLVRSITEVPLQPNGILGGEFFAFMALLVYSFDRAALRNLPDNSINTLNDQGSASRAAAPPAIAPAGRRSL